MKKIFMAITFSAMTILSSVHANAGSLSEKLGDGYIGVGLGGFNLNLGSDFKKTAFGGYIKGGTDINEWLGAELRVGLTGSAKKSIVGGGTAKGSASWFISYLLKPQYTFSDTARVYALIGGTTARIKTSVTGFPSDKFTKTGITYGVGGEYVVADNIALGVEWVKYWHRVSVDSTKYVGGKAKMWGATGTLTYLF